MARILHVLPHRGGGAETYVDLLAGLSGYEHERFALSSSRAPLLAGPSIAARAGLLTAAVLRADLVHAHGDVASALALPALRARPSVWTTHGLHFLRRARGARLALARPALRAAVAATARTVCTSRAERDELAALVPEEGRARLVVVRNGIALPPATSPAERAATRAALGLGDGDVAVLYVGQLETRKGVADALAAAERARADGAPVVLLLAGSGPLAGEVAAHAGPAVRPLGQRRDVPALLGAADVFLMPSEREGLSFAVLEALSHGLATVVSDGPGNPEAVGGAGVVVPFGDRRALAAALARLAGDAAERARLGAAARERVRAELTPEAMRAGVADAYAAAFAG